VDFERANKVYAVFQARFRPRRIRKMLARSGLTASTTVLDVGGTDHFWAHSAVQPELTILNIAPFDYDGRKVVGDGCRLPFVTDAFDFVISNSVIEHVPDHQAFAREIARVGKRYYVQTPNKWFPIEPHLMTPLIHLLPRSWQYRCIRFSLWSLVAKPTVAEQAEHLDTTHLITPRGMMQLFPGAEMERERFLGLTKSMAVWGGGPPPSG
jgi:SAM-dependent methyltransferase